ncbi:MAG TPA: PQQ-binding-like beta-propeller repeat protein [Candidatus Acidoferrum sp.]|nr:PQQ-binding-like beta-propeller repeat protein [Candidatus Acidoferrum sp.]
MKRLLLLSVLTFCSPLFAQEAMFRGNPQHTGIYPGPAVPQFTKIKWQFSTKGQVLSSPAIADGSLYVGSSDHFLYALDASNGALRWKFKTAGRITSSPAVSAGLVYFGSFDSNFYAVDAATGQLKWKFATAGERRFAAKHLHGAEPAAETMPDPFDFYLSSPVVASGAVYFGSGDTNIYALDAATGVLKWKFKTGDVVHSSPALSDGTLFAGSWDSNFYALDAATGKEKWRFKTGEDPDIHNQVGIQSSAAVANGVVYFGCRDSKFYAVDAATGKQLWFFSNKGSWVIASPAVIEGRVYFATSDSGLIHALDAKSGAPLFSADNKHWPMFSSPAIAGDTLYIGSHEGKLLAIDLKTQKFAWTFATDGSKENGSTYTKSDGSPKYEAAFFDFFYDDMVSGVQKMMTVGAILSSPAIANGTIYVGSTDGNIYALI